MSYVFQPMDEASARAIAAWRYPAPYDLYNTPSDAVEQTIAVFMDPQYAYHVLADEQGEIVAFCCFGPDAQVPGGDYRLHALDIGLGVRPDLTGQGQGSDFVSAVLNFAQGVFEPVAFRVTVAEFNKRALRVWQKAGFEPVQTFPRQGDGKVFVVLTRDVSGTQKDRVEQVFRFTSDPRRLKQALWSLVLIGLAIRIAAVLVLNDYRDPLAAEYGIVARNLVTGEGFVGGGWLGPEAPTALNTPIYPMFLATWLRLGGLLPFLGVELSQALLSALLAFLVGKIARHLSDSLTGLLAALFVALYPPLIYFCVQISPAIFTTFFTIFSFYMILHFFKKPSWMRAVACGLVFGVSLLVEPILLVAIPGATLISWIWWYKGDRRAVVGRLAVGAAISAMVVLPWTARNYVVFQQVALLKTSFGLNLWLGNNPEATGFLYTVTGVPMQDTLPASMRDYLGTLNEAERYTVLEREAWEWIRLHPRQFLGLTAKRVGYLWWISPTYQVTDQNIVEPRYFYVTRAMIQALLLLFGLAGSMVACRRNRLLLVMSMWWLVAFTVPYAISVAGNTRYRLPVEPVLILLGAFCLSEGWRWRKGRT